MVAYRIKELREKRGITQTDLSNSTGIARATIWKLETGTNSITTTKTLEKIAEALGAELSIRFIDKETGEPIE